MVKCKHCGREFVKKGKRLYCSPLCYHTANKAAAKERSARLWREDHEGMLAYARAMREQRKERKAARS